MQPTQKFTWNTQQTLPYYTMAMNDKSVKYSRTINTKEITLILVE